MQGMSHEYAFTPPPSSLARPHALRRKRGAAEGSNNAWARPAGGKARATVPGRTSNARSAERRRFPPWSVDPLLAHILTEDLDVHGRARSVLAALGAAGHLAESNTFGI
jgi:hypothetical protein